MRPSVRRDIQIIVCTARKIFYCCVELITLFCLQSFLQSTAGEDLYEVVAPTEEETIINFSRTEPSSDLVLDSEQQQDVVYANIKVSKTPNSLTQTAGGSEDLYAQVKKK